MNWKETGRKIWTEIRNTLYRVARSDFHKVKASDEERKKMASAKTPLTESLTQDYCSWRKGMLWVAALSLAVLALIDIFTYKSWGRQMAESISSQDAAFQRTTSESRRESIIVETFNNIKRNFGSDNIGIIDGIQAVMILSNLTGAVLIFIAAFVWANMRLSRRLALWGWLIMFLVPFMLAILPITGIIDWGMVRDDLEKQLKPTLGLIFALSFFMTVGPKAISLFPGVIRSSLTLKTLLPESSTPGWAAAIFAPFYSLFLVVVASTMIQMHGDALLLFGILALMTAPMVYLLRRKSLLQPGSEEEVSKAITKTRRITIIFNAAGAVLVCIFILNLDIMNFGDAAKFIITIVGSVLAMTVVAADFIMGIMWKSYQDTEEFMGTPLQRSLEMRFRALMDDEGGMQNTMIAGPRVKSRETLLEMPASATDESDLIEVDKFDEETRKKKNKGKG